MRPLTKQWLSKAQGDYRVMHREFRAVDEPSYDAVCFHAQQCIEKLLKGFLQENDLAFPKTHDLRELLSLSMAVRPEWEPLLEPAAILTKYAIEFRYPGDDADRDEAQEAVAYCDRLRNVVLDAIKKIDQLRL